MISLVAKALGIIAVDSPVATSHTGNHNRFKSLQQKFHSFFLLNRSQLESFVISFMIRILYFNYILDGVLLVYL